MIRSRRVSIALSTRSRFARRLLNDWTLERDKFWQVAPKEMLNRLAQPLSDRVEEARA